MTLTVSSVPGLIVPGLFWPGSAALTAIPSSTPGSVSFTEVPGNCVAGNVEQWTATFTNLLGVAQDPSYVEFKYSINRAFNSGVTLTWAGATSPSAGVVARTGVGVYVAQVDTTNLAGYWTFEWLCPSGLGQCLEEGFITVSPAPLS